MAKNERSDIPADMWLHVATDALARYVAAGGTLETAEVYDDKGDQALLIIVPVATTDPRLAQAFTALFSAAPAPAEGAAD